jgi:2-polyprenyl-3-methyl-5-hydroxy-6-metoxy-1,4-benzoquinol methylase
MGSEPANALASLPDAYRRWRASWLGRITDALEEQLILELVGPPAGLRILDVGCGDAVLAVTLAQRGALVTGIDADLRMLAAGRARARQAASPSSSCRRISVSCRSPTAASMSYWP